MVLVELRRHVVDRVRAMRDAFVVALDEHDGAARARRGRDGADDRDLLGLDVAVQRVPVDPVVEVALEGLGVEQAREPHAGQREDLARVAERP